MKTKYLSRAGIALVMSAAACSIFFSQHAFAQGGAESGFSALIGRDRIRPDDARFQPAAAMVMHEAETARTASPGGKTVIAQTVLRDFFDRYVINIPGRIGQGGQPRNLTAAETALLEELFSRNLSKSKTAEINRNGLSGSIRPGDVDEKASDVLSKAKARAIARSKWYGEGAAGLGPI